MPGVLELLFAFVVVVAFPIWDYVRIWPAMKARLQSGVPDARVRSYGVILRQEWGAAAIVAALWLANRRAWTALGLVLPSGWKLVLAIVLVLAVVVLLLQQLRAIGRIDSSRRARLASRLGSDVSLALPHTQQERGWFAAVSVTAGICEELVYRGFLIWALQPWAGAWGAAAVSLAGFTFAHAYQGKGFVVRTGGAGACPAPSAMHPRRLAACALDELRVRPAVLERRQRGFARARSIA